MHDVSLHGDVMADVATKSEWTRFRRAVVAMYEDLRPGEYVQVKKTHRHRNLHAVVRCADCGSLSSITREQHDVNWNGSVSPASECPGHNCGASWLHLQNWHPEPKGNA